MAEMPEVVPLKIKPEPDMTLVYSAMSEACNALADVFHNIAVELGQNADELAIKSKEAAGYSQEAPSDRS